MFPLKANDPYIKETGERSTLGNVVGGGGSDTPELPDYSIADAGKVLKVGDDGSLEWDTSGAGGGDDIILDYFELTEETGSHVYANNIVISESGSYMILIGGFLSSTIVKINNETQPNTLDANSSYHHWYHESSKVLSAGDVIDISLSSSGKTMFVANIIKLGS